MRKLAQANQRCVRISLTASWLSCLRNQLCGAVDAAEVADLAGAVRKRKLEGGKRAGARPDVGGRQEAPAR